jgi:3-deoxy-D-manno-octulosonic acid (KDO) 8-phosphate synthase
MTAIVQVQKGIFTNPSKITFQQDGALAHNMKKVIDCLRGKYFKVWGGLNVWPENSQI